VSVWQACDHHGPGPGQPHPAAGEVLFDGSVVGPTNIPIAVLAEQRRVRVHDPDNGIGWDIIVTTASVPTALETSLDLGKTRSFEPPNHFLPPLACTGSYPPVASATPRLP
jgi:hypothetical protein